VQQISLSQRVTKNEMESKKDSLKNGLKTYPEGIKDGLKVDIESLKEYLTKFLQEMLPNGENLLDETHDENKRNVNDDFKDSNSRLKTHHIPKIDIRKFDGNYPVTWIFQMEQYFDIHNVQHIQKVHIEYLYLESN